MENLAFYILKACGLTALFFTAYYVLLRKETFFKSNRWFLLAGLFTAALLPLVVFTKIVWIEPAPQLPIQQFAFNQLPIVSTPQPINETPLEINWFYVVAVAYGAGLLFFFIRLIADVFKVRKMLHSSKSNKQGQFKLIDNEAVESPFSFFNYIVYNSATLQPQELNSIISHEKVHSSQRHSLDVLVAQLFCIVFWFNPVAWLYKRAISQNLEFIADADAIKFIEDKIGYQKTLLKITLQPECIAITNHFYQPLIKKRIVMINKQQSNKINSLKYTLVLPALAAFIFMFQVNVVAQEKEPATKKTHTVKASFTESINIVKTDTDAQLQAKAQVLVNAFKCTIIISNVKRNVDKEITAIKVEGKYNGQSKTYEISDDKPITTFKVEIADNDNGESELNFITTTKQAFVNQPAGKVKKGTAKISSISTLQDDGKPDPDVLYIIDGIAQKPGVGLKNINATDIDKIEVRKDYAEIIKLYGKDAKNGVILITTKKAGSGKSLNTIKKVGGLFDPQSPSLDTPISELASNQNQNTIRRYTVTYEGKPNDSIPAYKAGVQFYAGPDASQTFNKLTTYYNVVPAKNAKATPLKSLSEMSAEELDAAYKQQQNMIDGIDKMIITNKDSKAKGAVLTLEQMKENRKNVMKEIKKAKKELKKRP